MGAPVPRAMALASPALALDQPSETSVDGRVTRPHSGAQTRYSSSRSASFIPPTVFCTLPLT
jgi:hypothetical protein